MSILTPDMKDIIRQIREEKHCLELTAEQYLKVGELLEKNEVMQGIPTEDGCKCPRCSTALIKGEFICPHCGQRAMYKEAKDIPL